jgi:tRNA (cmo5U34)-methyltransferase
VVAHFARHYVNEGGLIYDVGASTGNVGRAIADTITARKASLVAIEPSKEMAARYAGPGKLVVADACGFNFKPYDFAVCFLVLMFIAPGDRCDLLKKLRSKMKPGGAILVFDKCQPVGGYAATAMQRLTLAGKVSAGVDAKEVIAKELSLAGAQRPIAPSELPRGAVEIFRFGEFAGWLIEAAYPDADQPA